MSIMSCRWSSAFKSLFWVPVYEGPTKTYAKLMVTLCSWLCQLRYFIYTWFSWSCSTLISPSGKESSESESEFCEDNPTGPYISSNPEKGPLCKDPFPPNLWLCTMFSNRRWTDSPQIDIKNRSFSPWSRACSIATLFRRLIGNDDGKLCPGGP